MMYLIVNSGGIIVEGVYCTTNCNMSIAHNAHHEQYNFKNYIYILLNMCVCS